MGGAARPWLLVVILHLHAFHGDHNQFRVEWIGLCLEENARLGGGVASWGTRGIENRSRHRYRAVGGVPLVRLLLLADVAEFRAIVVPGAGLE